MNFSNKIGDRDLISRFEFTSFQIADDDLVACLKHGPKISHVSFEARTQPSWYQLEGLNRGLCGNVNIPSLVVRMDGMIDCNLAILLSTFWPAVTTFGLSS